MLLQAAAWPRLCTQLRLAAGLRELVLGLHGKAGTAVPDRLSVLGRLSQLRALQLTEVSIDAPCENFTAALAPLTGLTRLDLQFAEPRMRKAAAIPFPWEHAISGLIHLRELRAVSDGDSPYRCSGMFRGSLPAALSRLTALRHLELLGMAEAVSHADFNHLQLSALPALETAALQLLMGQSGRFESLRCGQLAELSRLVSLSLCMRVDLDPHFCEDTHLPTIIAPSLTELTLSDIKLASDSQQLSWLPDLPKLRRLVLVDVQQGSDQLPQGIIACSGLTELVLQQLRMNCGFGRNVCYGNSKHVHVPQKDRLCKLPKGPFLGQLRRLSLSDNGFATVPRVLVSAKMLEFLDLSYQHLPLPKSYSSEDYPWKRVKGLHVLKKLTGLRYLKLREFKKDDDAVRDFQEARPDVTLDFEYSYQPAVEDDEDDAEESED